MTAPMGDPAPAAVVTVGETMGLVTQAVPGSISHHRGMTLGMGGAESNVAIGLTRLGTTARWIGRLGSDDIGDLVLRELRAEGVRTTVIRDPAPTALMIKTRRTARSTRVTYYRTNCAGSHLCPDDLDESAIGHASLLHVTGITPALSTSARDTVFAAIEIARAADVPVSFDVNHRSALWRDRGGSGTAGRVFRDLAARATIVFAGDDEARMLLDPDDPAATGDEPTRLAATISALGPRHVVVKLGSAGCAAWIDGRALTRPAVDVDVVDTVGAGDAFVAGYLADVVAGETPERRLATAVAAGAFVVTTPGDWEGLPTRAELSLLTARDPVVR